MVEGKNFKIVSSVIHLKINYIFSVSVTNMIHSIRAKWGYIETKSRIQIFINTTKNLSFWWKHQILIAHLHYLFTVHSNHIDATTSATLVIWSLNIIIIIIIMLRLNEVKQETHAKDRSTLNTGDASKFQNRVIMNCSWIQVSCELWWKSPAVSKQDKPSNKVTLEYVVGVYTLCTRRARGCYQETKVLKASDPDSTLFTCWAIVEQPSEIPFSS